MGGARSPARRPCAFLYGSKGQGGGMDTSFPDSDQIVINLHPASVSPSDLNVVFDGKFSS
jgi:hypothetical protein